MGHGVPCARSSAESQASGKISIWFAHCRNWSSRTVRRSGVGRSDPVPVTQCDRIIILLIHASKANLLPGAYRWLSPSLVVFPKTLVLSCYWSRRAEGELNAMPTAYRIAQQRQEMSFPGFRFSGAHQHVSCRSIYAVSPLASGALRAAPP